MAHAIRVLSVLIFAYAALSQTAGKLQGIVHDDSGNPVVGAYAIATAQSASDHSTYRAITGSQGDYTFNSLPPGKYAICVQAPGGPHLNPCQWSTGTQGAALGGAQVVTVASGQTLANQTVAVTPGALLQIRLAAPSN